MGPGTAETVRYREGLVEAVRSSGEVSGRVLRLAIPVLVPCGVYPLFLLKSAQVVCFVWVERIWILGVRKPLILNGLRRGQFSLFIRFDDCRADGVFTERENSKKVTERVSS